MIHNNHRKTAKSRSVSVAVKSILVLIVLLLGFGIFSYWYMVKCEGDWRGEPMEQQGIFDLSAIKQGLESDVAFIAGLGPRNSIDDASFEQLKKCETWIIEKWKFQGYSPKLQEMSIDGRQVCNIEIEFPGTVSPSEIVIISAQYDTEPESPGANNNGSGMAILFQLSDLLKEYHPGITLRLVAFVNEQYPYADTEMMGSYHYARRSFELKEDIQVMMSMDALGIYKDDPGTQRLPFPFSLFYPDRGNFLAFIGNLSSRSWVKKVTAGFKRGSAFPIAGGIAPEWVEGVTWSDHRSFYKFGYPGMQITDTGAFRAASHGTSDDTIDKINFDALSRIVVGMYGVILEITGS